MGHESVAQALGGLLENNSSDDSIPELEEVESTIQSSDISNNMHVPRHLRPLQAFHNHNHKLQIPSMDYLDY